MKAKLMFGVSVVVAAVLAFGQQNRKAQPPSTGKFSMVVAEVDEGTKASTVFVINSDTGRSGDGTHRPRSIRKGRQRPAGYS